MVTVQPEAGAPDAIVLRNVFKSYTVGNGRNHQELRILEDVSFTVPDKPEGEFVALLGPSGCGKSTILNMLAGLLEPDKGEVFSFGRKVEGLNPAAVTVPQSYTCFPWLTAQQNVEFGLLVNPETRRQAPDIAREYLTKVGLGDRPHAMPRELSGGMQQRVAIARALAVKPKLLLMDEPFGALDANIRAEMQQMLLGLWTEEKNTVLFVTHDITEALLLADRVIVLTTKPAKVVQDLTVPFTRPRSQQLQFDENFMHLGQSLLSLLKSPEGPTGQVRVSV